MKKIVLLFTLIFGLQNLQAQDNQTLARAYFIKAREAYSESNNKTAIEYLEKTITTLGNTNAKIEGLLVKIAIADDNYFEAKEHLDNYFRLAKTNHSDYDTMSGYILEVNDKVDKLKEIRDKALERDNDKFNTAKQENTIAAYQYYLDNIEGYYYYRKNKTYAKAQIDRLTKAKAAHAKARLIAMLENPALMFEDYFIPIKGGTFEMGDIKGKGDDGEKPVHQVTLTDFNMGVTEITVAMYRVYCKATDTSMPDAPRWGWNDNDPMVYVSYNDAMAFCKWASSITGKTIMLPTEAQWEYAARGGQKNKGYLYSGSNDIDKVAWNGDDYKTGSTHEVATKQANELGLYDMSGNVWEWCLDYYNPKTYKKKYGQGTNPVGPKTGSKRVLRGGDWNDSSSYCRVADRGTDLPDFRYDIVGFRLVFF